MSSFFCLKNQYLDDISHLKCRFGMILIQKEVELFHGTVKNILKLTNLPFTLRSVPFRSAHVPICSQSIRSFITLWTLTRNAFFRSKSVQRIDWLKLILFRLYIFFYLTLNINKQSRVFSAQSLVANRITKMIILIIFVTF